jgi:RNA polymerase sigma factor (sigma-70 family)
MSDHSTTLRYWIGRHNAGDPKAANELLRYSQRRFAELASSRLDRFRRLRGFENSDDVLVGAQARFDRAMKELKFDTLDDFLRLGAEMIRRQLLDLTRHYFGPHGDGTHRGPSDPLDEGRVVDTGAEQVDIDDAIDRLPPDLRNAFTLWFIQGLTQKETARLLGISLSTIKLRLVEARAVLGATFAPRPVEKHS